MHALAWTLLLSWCEWRKRRCPARPVNPFSAQGLVKVPIDLEDKHAAALGRDRFDLELSLLYGNRHRMENGTFFYNPDVGYRRRDATGLSCYARLVGTRRPARSAPPGPGE